MRDMVAGEVAKSFALEDILPKDVAEGHKSGDIHFHDLDYSPLFPQFNCMLIDLGGMLKNGFKMGNAAIETPNSITTASAITAQIIAQVASHIYGGNTINRIDEVLAPYVRKTYKKHYAIGMQLLDFVTDKDMRIQRSAIYAEKRTEKDTYDAFQSLEYEINTLHTANGQTPFVTLGFGLGTCWESRLIQRSILNVRRSGLGKDKRTAVFPKLIFAIKDGVNHKEGDRNYDIKRLALACSSERMYPDILNYEKLVEVTGGFKTPMGCRSFLSEYAGGDHDGRNNLGVVSINLPRLAIKAGTVEEFYSLLDDKLELCKEALLCRIERFKGVKAEVAPILYTEGACGVKLKPDDEIMQLFENGRATISLGYIGLNEMANAMFSEDSRHTFDSDTKKAFCLEVVRRLREATDLWKKDTGWGFGLYSTPSESLCDRFCRLDKENYGDIVGVTDKDYYTNSFHLDVAKKVSPYDKIDFECKYPVMANGGFISFAELPDMRNFLDALEDVWDYSYNKVPYFGTNTPVDYCGVCSYAGESVATENGFTCPSCGNNDPETLQVTRRVCGYLSAPNARPLIHGKQAEVMQRVKHTGD